MIHRNFLLRAGAALAILLIALVAAAPRASAQAISGDLVGTILDPTAAAVPNTAIEAKNVNTGVAYSAVSNPTGEYRFRNLPPGTYNVTALAPGFERATLANVKVALNQVATANLTLHISQASESVSVVESSAVIDTTTAQILSTFDSKQMADLPTASVGSGVLNMSLLNAGVASAGGIGVGTGPSVGGQRPRNNNFTVEGVDNNSKSTTGPQAFIPNDAVAEFSLLQNQFSPEYGHSSGGQFNTIVKSGTNEFHGKAYLYNQNRNYNALDQAFANEGTFDKPRYDQNRLGAAFGGPIQQNKWFFFGNVEYNPLGQASTSGGQLLTPTAEGYSILSGIPGIRGTNLDVFKQWVPAAPSATSSITVGGVSVPVGVLPVMGPNYQNGTYGVGSMDYNISERDQIRGRYVYNKYEFIDTAANIPAFFTTVPVTNYLATIAEYHTFSPALTNELRIGFNRNNQVYPAGDAKFTGLDVFPNITIDQLGSINIGPDPNAPQGGIQNLYQGADNVTWTRGRHTLKVGTEFRKYISPQFFTQRARGDYEWSNLEGFLMDTAPDVFGERSAGNPTFYGDQIATYSYANDNWNIRPNLSLNLGVRYEYTTVPYTMRDQTLNAIASVPGVLDFSKEPQFSKKNFAPRVGLAYSPGKSGNTSIRAGFGIAHDVLFDNIGLLGLPPQLSTTVDVGLNGPPKRSPNFFENGAISGATAGSVLTAEEARAYTAGYFPLNMETPYSIQWNFGIQHVFKKDYTFEARYLGTRGVHLFVQSRLNLRSLVDAEHNLPTYTAMPSASTLASLPYTLEDLASASPLVPAFENAGFFSPIAAWTPQGYSSYNGLALQLTRRFSNGLQFVGSYTWSHLIDNSTSEVMSTYLTPRRPQDFFNMAAERGDSALDRRHRFTFSTIYDVPWFQHADNRLKRNLLGNWELAPTYTYESPEYFTVQSGVDSNLNGDPAGDRAIVNPSGAAHTASDVYAIDRNGNRVDAGDPSTVAYVAVSPNARYITAGEGALANAGRNTEATRPINNVDLTLMKRLSFGERWKVELAGQAFNLFNHAQFIPGSINDVKAITTTAGSGTASLVRTTSPVFGRSDLAFSSNPRSMQLFIKLIW